MKDLEKTENNTLIALFMGYVWSREQDGKTYLKRQPLQLDIYSLRPINLGYHRSWDWLMPVVEKIEKIGETDDEYGCIVHISTIDVRINKKIAAWSESKKYYSHCLVDLKLTPMSKIDATYKAVIEFIKWYNKQHKNGNEK